MHLPERNEVRDQIEKVKKKHHQCICCEDDWAAATEDDNSTANYPPNVCLIEKATTLNVWRGEQQRNERDTWNSVYSGTC